MAQQITLEERDRIADLTSRGFSQAEIARRLLRSQSTISRELKRNGTASERYAAGAAQQLAEHRRTDRPLVRKMDRPEICSVVQKGLHDDWSPDQISGHLKAQFPDLKSRHISADTIYDWIEKDEHRQMWKGHLRRRGKRPCRRKDRAKDDAARIRNRPDVIELRGRLGDFEGDTVLGPSGTGGIVTLVCRLSRLTRIIRIESKHANHVYGRTRKCLLRVPSDKRHSITFDNGTEFAECHRLETSRGIRLYFADPGCPHQRGTNENTNGLLRQYFPKGTDFRTVSHAELRRVETLINNRPRACLGYKTPNDVFFRSQ